MTPVLLTLAAFAAWWLIGLALLALVQADTTSLRVALTAPALGTSVTVLATFLLSHAGMAVEHFAVPLTAGLLLIAVVVIAVRRPRLPVGVAPVILISVAGLLLGAWPMLSLGFRWLSNGNDDMANYVLSAQQFLHHGLWAPFDFTGLLQGRDYATVTTSLHAAGGRPGSDMLLALVSRIAGRPPYETFMPLILAFNLCGASAVGALALQVSRRWWAAVLAAGLLLVSPLATYGVLQQLIAQVWGLGLAAAMLALLMRPELHGGRGPRVRDVIPTGALASGLVLGYVELVPVVGLAYMVYVAALGARKQLTVSALTRLWLPIAAIALIVVNSYLLTELSYVTHQATAGVRNVAGPPLFGYILVPTGLPSVVGLQTLVPGSGAHLLNLTIVLAAVIILGTVVGSVVSARRGTAAAAVLIVEAALGVFLAVKGRDFGLFKLSMYVQPFLAAAVAIWLSGTIRRPVQAAAAVLLLVLVAAELSSQRAYVKASRDPGDVPHLSAADVIPAFHSMVTRNPGPVVSVTENPVLIKLEAASAEGRPVYFQSRDVFTQFLREYASEVSGAKRGQAVRALRSGVWVSQSFHLFDTEEARDSFAEDTSASRSLGSGRCDLVLPSPSELPFNRYSLPAVSPNLMMMPCDAPHNLLAFTSSNLGQSFYLPAVRRDVSFFQLQQDPYFPDGRMVGFGRYALFRVLGPSSGERLVIEMTDTLNNDGANLLPPAAVVGSSRLALPVQGRGSTRVFSPPLKPQIIAGAPYVLVDMGVNGRLPATHRSGVQDIYGRSVPTDPRYLTGYVRDISLVSAAQYANLHPPLALRNFPGDLHNPDLEYSGLYEDGWMGSEGYVTLAGGPAADLVVQGQIPAGAGKHVELLVNGRQVASVALVPGPLYVRAAVPASSTRRRVELRFAASIRLKAPDLRPASALLSFVGFVARAHGR
jgi:hypothetical protein